MERISKKFNDYLGDGDDSPKEGKEKQTRNFSLASRLAPPAVAISILELERLAGVHENPSWIWQGEKIPQELANWIDKLRGKNLARFFGSDFLKVKGSIGTPEPVNSFLQQEGMTLRLQDMRSQDALYSAAVLMVLGEWVEPGKRTTVELRQTGKKVDAVSIVGEEDLPSGISIYGLNSVGHNDELEKVVSVRTRLPDVYFVLYQPNDFVPEKAYATLERIVSGIQGSESNNFRRESNYRGVVFPMVDYQLTEQKLPEIVGATLFVPSRSPVIINQAMAHLSLRLNEIGVEARASAAMGALRGGFFDDRRKILLIDRPFFVGVVVNHSLVMAVPVSEDYMKDPGDIGAFGRGKEDSVRVYYRKSDGEVKLKY